MRALSLRIDRTPRGASSAIAFACGCFLSAAVSGGPAQAQTCDTLKYVGTNCDSLCQPDGIRFPILIQMVQKQRHTKLPFLVTSCQARTGNDPEVPTCIVTICGFLQTATPRTIRTKRIDTGRTDTPVPRIGPPQPDLLGEGGIAGNGPAAIGTPLATSPSSPASGANMRGGVR